MFMIICVLNMNQISFALPKLPPAPLYDCNIFLKLKMFDSILLLHNATNVNF